MPPVEYRLPAEWEKQSALLLAWPFPGSDWDPVLDEVQDEYAALIETALVCQTVVLLVPPGDRSSHERLGDPSGLDRIEMRYDDTWCRDYGPLVLCHAGRRLALDFHFNGWGGRHEARLDNRVNGHLARHELFADFDFRQSLFEIEGGAIESDGNGTMLINRHCLRARHPYLDDAEVDGDLRSWFNLDRLLEIDMPPMAGDDTDGHIDTLARFAAEDRIVFQSQRDASATRTLNGQLELLRTRDGSAFELISLPAPDDLEPGRPASYANFVLLNDAVLVPRYGSRADDEALDTLSEAFPDRRAIGIDAAVMIGQGGGPHCASMQIPAPLP